MQELLNLLAISDGVKSMSKHRIGSMKHSMIAGIFLLLLVPVIAFGQGNAGAQFLKINGGTRGPALGGAYTALADGVQSVYYNPAGIALIQGVGMNVTHTAWLADMSHESVAASMTTPQGTFAVSGIALLSGEILETTEMEPDGTGNTFTANSYAFGVSYARSLTNKFSGGVTLKLIQENLADVSASTWAFDVGALYRTGLQGNLQLGFAVRNFGPDYRFAGPGLEYRTTKGENPAEDEDVLASYTADVFALPMNLELGFAYDLFSNPMHSLTVMVNGYNAVDQSETISGGLEYWFMNTLAVRVGHTEINNIDWDTGNLRTENVYTNQGLTFGFGVALELMGNQKFYIDYTLENHQYLNSIHRFSVDYSL